MKQESHSESVREITRAILGNFYWSVDKHKYAGTQRFLDLIVNNQLAGFVSIPTPERGIYRAAAKTKDGRIIRQDSSSLEEAKAWVEDNFS